MSDQKTQNNPSDDLDEILVKEPDGTFRVVKVAPATNPPAGGGVTGQAAQSKPDVARLPRVEKPAPATMVLGDEEAKELSAVREKTKTIAPQVDDKSTDIARRAIAASGVVLTDPSLANRLQLVLVAAVKEVRKELETRDLLMRPKEQGGLEMTMDEATRLLALLTAKPTVTQIHTKPLSSPPSPLVVSKPVMPSPPAPQAPKPITVSPFPIKPTAPPITKQGVVTGQAPLPSLKVYPPPTPTPLKAPPPQPRQTSTPQNSSGQASSTPVASARKPIAPSAPPLQEVMRPPVETKHVVQDVTFTPRLKGPVDELQMNLAEWRRMAPTVKDRGIKIEEKLRLLEEESYADRLKGVAAWYASDVVRLYQDVGSESLVGGKPVTAVLADREARGQLTLTFEEFQSVAELNEKLRF